MLGRATRKCDEIDKTSYKVFDAARNYIDMKDFSDMNPVVNNPQIDMEKLLIGTKKVKASIHNLLKKILEEYLLKNTMMIQSMI